MHNRYKYFKLLDSNNEMCFMSFVTIGVHFRFVSRPLTRILLSETYMENRKFIFFFVKYRLICIPYDSTEFETYCTVRETGKKVFSSVGFHLP